jgi:hypothetical protein
MFIASRSFFTPQLRRSATAFACPGEFRRRVSLLKARDLWGGGALVAINLSLLWHEKEFN